MIKREYYPNVTTMGNFYPMPTAAVLQDITRRVTILSNVEHDRVIKTDDSKGLGSGNDGIPRDILPVNMDFVILIEKISGTAKWFIDGNGFQQQKFNYNTIAGHQALQSLIYPPTLFTRIGKNLHIKFISNDDMVIEFPCDVQLITVRPLNDSPNQRLMILHRAGIYCGGTATTPCRSGDLSTAILSYLKSIHVTKLQRTQLNGIDTIGTKKNVDDEEFSIEPMDFLTYIIDM
ncbi:unnamed protein product [Dracunculus medinensis]|uniref:LO8 n=1 Tax=Dracunculus medinensis TaxID=318479 RepID=A0A0N4UF18_DRAME|nr:unnamed protein product [Dracunculus medinensis]